MGVLNLLGDIASGSYNPSLNPDAYGVDAQGRIVDKSGNPTNLYSQPSWFQKAFNPNARSIQMQNLQGQGAPLVASQQANVARSTGEQMYGLNNDTYANFGNRPVTNEERNANTQAQLFAQQGGNPVAAQDTLTSAQNQLIGNKALQSSGNLWREQLAHAGDLQYGIGLNDARLGALPNTTAALQNQAAIEAGTTGQQRTDLPLTTGAMANQDTIANIMSRRAPTVPFMDSRLMGNQLMAPSRDPLGISPYAMQMASINAIGQGQGGMTQHTLPSGLTINAPAPQYSEGPTTPLIGQQSNYADSAPSPITANPNLRSLQEHPDIMYDNSTGRIYTSQGQDVTNDPRYAIFKRAASIQETQMQKEVKDAHHEAAMADLKAKQKAIEAQHLHEGLVPNAYRTISEPIGNTINQGVNAVKAGYNNAYNTLIGQ